MLILTVPLMTLALTWPNAVCSQARLKWADDDEGGRRLRLEEDLDGDGRPDLLEGEESQGSGMSSTVVKLSLTSSGHTIEVGSETSFYALYGTTDVPEALRGPKHREALKRVEEALFGTLCDRVDPSLAWLVASHKRLLWIAGPPRLPSTYTVRLSQARFRALADGNVALETAAAAPNGDELWLTYLGDVHRREVPLNPLQAKSPLRSSPYELARRGQRVLLGTAHAVILTNPRQTKHAWLYVHQDPEHNQKLRIPSIQGARIRGSEALVDIDPFAAGVSTAGAGEPSVPFQIHVNLATGAVSHAFDDNAAAALKRSTQACEEGDTGACVQRDQGLCAQGQGTGCFNAGLAYVNGEGVAKSARRAASLYERACGLREKEACTNLGALYETGEGVREDVARARDLYTQGCEMEDAAGCNNLAVLHEEGRGVAVDLEQAIRLYQKSCSLGHAPACEDARRLAPR